MALCGCGWKKQEDSARREGDGEADNLSWMAAATVRSADDCPPHQLRRRQCCFYGWVVWAVTLAGNVVVFFGASSGVTFIIPPVRESLGLSQSGVALAYTAGTALSALAQYPLGRAVDKFGGRVGIVATSACFACSLVALSMASSWWTLAFAFGLMRTLGVGGLETACNTCLQQWFIRRRGLATGLGSSIVQLLSYALVSNIDAALVQSIGWRRTYAFAGLAVLALYSPLALLLLRSRPEDMQLRPDGDEPYRGPPHASSSPLYAVDEDAGTTGGGGGTAAEAPGADRVPDADLAPDDGSYTLREAAHTRSFVLLALGNALAWGVGSGVFFNLTSIALDAGLKESDVASAIYIPWAICRALSMVSAGLALDAMEPRWVLSLGLFLNGSGIYLLSRPFGDVLTPLGACVFGIVHGLGNGASSCTFKAACALQAAR